MSQPFELSMFCKETYDSARRVGYPLGRLLGLDDATIADAIQDAYVHVLSSINDLQARAPDHRVGNLCATVKYKVWSAYRQRCRQRSVDLSYIDTLPDMCSSDDVDDVVARLASRSEWERVKEALPLLSRPHRELLAFLIADALDDDIGSTAAERDRRIATELGKSEGAVRAQRIRAVSALKHALAQRDDSSDGKEELGHGHT